MVLLVFRDALADLIVGFGANVQGANGETEINLRVVGARDTLATLTLERVRYGARVARLTGLPVLVSGGRGWCAIPGRAIPR